MGIDIKLVSGETININGDSITYAEGGNVLEVLSENEEILGAFRNWEYAIVQESEAEYQRSLNADLDDEDEDFDEDDLDDEELDDEELDDEESEEEPSVEEEQAVQRARQVMQRAIAEHNGQPPVPIRSVGEIADQLTVEHADILARLSEDD